MKQFSASVPIGIGDLIYLKAMFDAVKHEYSLINFDMYTELIGAYKKDPATQQFVNDLSRLLFSEPPYTLNSGSAPFQTMEQISSWNGVPPQKPELANLLCAGQSLEIGPYIVINTKVRYVNQLELDEKIPEFWALLNQLSSKYKIVILGEKVIEMNPEYQVHNSNGTYIFSLYPHIFNNMPHEPLVDLSVPALGVTSPNLQKLRQDCLIMNQAKFVIQFGVGGSFCLATAVANTVGYRTDCEYIGDRVFDRIYPNAVITKDWSLFLSTLKGYL